MEEYEEINYNTIKAVAKKDKKKVKDYLALSPGNDPYYNTPGNVINAEWFADIYAQMGKPIPCHIRRVHYWYVSRQGAVKPNGMPYENTERDWDLLEMASKYARYLKDVSGNFLVPPENIVDHRNPPITENIFLWDDEKPSEVMKRLDGTALIDDIVKQFYCWTPHNTQAYHLEIWCEKSTMDDILEPIGQHYGLNIVTGLGEMSVSRVHELVCRIKKNKKPVRILYISDFDPAGEGMPVSIARKIEFYLHFEDAKNVKLRQVLLTPEQCIKYELPRKPIKDTDKRKEGFEERHGSGATELDALESLHPGEMRQLLIKEIEFYFDADAWNSVVNKKDELRHMVREHLTANMDKVMTPLVNVLKEIDLSDMDDYKPPVGKEVNDDHIDWLYDSKLEYFLQLEKYKEWRRKTSINKQLKR